MNVKELSLKIFRKYHNLQIPELPEIITNYVIQKQETIENVLFYWHNFGSKIKILDSEYKFSIYSIRIIQICMF